LISCAAAAIAQWGLLRPWRDVARRLAFGFSEKIADGRGRDFSPRTEVAEA